jgi:hypothetical protein
MFAIETIRTFCTTLVIALLCAVSAGAGEHPYLKPVAAPEQQPVAPAPPPAAPVPAQIQTSKRVFISNAGGEFRDWYVNDRFSGAPNRLYNQFYAAMKDWAHYQLVTAPADADLIFEVHATDLYMSGNEGIPRFELTIYDPKTHVVLWRLTEAVDIAILKGNRDKNFDKGIGKLVSDVRQLVDTTGSAEAPASSATRPHNSSPQPAEEVTPSS